MYSLGVLFYELLIGTTPIGRERARKEALHRILELVITEQTPRPSRRLSKSDEKAIIAISEQRQIEHRKLAKTLKRELDWIALKSLQKERDRRYHSAGSLADDVANYLDRGIVAARPPSVIYQLGKVLRRNRFAILGSATVFLMLLLFLAVGLSVALILTNRKILLAEEARFKAESVVKEALKEQELNSQIADAKLAEARKSLDEHKSVITELRKQLEAIQRP